MQILNELLGKISGLLLFSDRKNNSRSLHLIKFINFISIKKIEKILKAYLHFNIAFLSDSGSAKVVKSIKYDLFSAKYNYLITY